MTVYATARAAQLAARASRGFPANPSRHLTGRFGFGTSRPDPLSSDPDRWFADQIAKGKRYVGYAGVVGLTSAFPCLTLTPPQTRDWLKANMGNEMSLDATVQLEQATLSLQVWSPAQLYEAVVEVMSNHLNVTNGQLNTWCARQSYDLDVIRKNAFGTFESMLLASAKHPAMLVYLSNAYSFKGALNENYGRELLELHTVGRAAGYSQDDVLSSTRVLTGRCVEFSRTVYGYNLNRHETGPVQVLGFRNDNASARNGEAVGDSYLRYLARHPLTARNLATKFCVRFVSDAPPKSLIDSVAKAYLDKGTSIVAMLETIVRSSEFWSSAGAKLRRPSENVVATARAVRVQAGSDLRAAGAALANAARVAGQQPLAWLAPDGYPDTATAWLTAGSFTAAWQFQFDLLGGKLGTALQAAAPEGLMGAATAGTVSIALQSLHQTLTGVVLIDSAVAAVLTYLGESGSRAYQGSKLQSSLPAVAALMLHGPAHAQR